MMCICFTRASSEITRDANENARTAAGVLGEIRDGGSGVRAFPCYPGNVGSGQADVGEFPVAQAIQFHRTGIVTKPCQFQCRTARRSRSLVE
jgi:hypothetical protein